MAFIEVYMLSPQKVIFEGRAKIIVVPGESGVFEVLPFHKPIVSRLIRGRIILDDKKVAIKRGIIKVEFNKATLIIEQ